MYTERPYNLGTPNNADVALGLQGAGQVASFIPGVGQIAGPILQIGGEIASLFGNPHPEGHNDFIRIDKNGALPEHYGGTQADSSTTAMAQAALQELLTYYQALQSSGYVFSNPPLAIEFRDDGSPAKLLTKENGKDWASHLGFTDSSGTVNLGAPNDPQGVASAYFQWLQSNNYITSPPASGASPIGAPASNFSGTGFGGYVTQYVNTPSGVVPVTAPSPTGGIGSIILLGVLGWGLYEAFKK